MYVHTDVLVVDGLLRLTMVSQEAKEEVPGKGQVVYIYVYAYIYIYIYIYIYTCEYSKLYY